MDPLEINASYHQQQLLDSARDAALARSLRMARSTTTPTTTRILAEIGRVIGRLRGGRRALAPRKASI